MRIDSERQLLISSVLLPFVIKEDIRPDFKIHLTWNWETSRHPSTAPIGGDLLQEYYKEENLWFCESKGGKAPVTCTCYPEDFSWMECAVNERPFLEPPDSLEQIFRLLPMRAVLQHFHILFLHASQVVIDGKGIVFTAPSGTGKTTQAKLWQRYMEADWVCNDRTLFHKEGNVWHTFGYPMDGSEPVCSNVVNQLGCIVLLKQGIVNQVTKLKVGQAIRALMEQMVLDCWNAEARVEAMELLLELLQDIPVYQQICTPDFEAVQTLREKLLQDGVIGNGADSKTSVG